MNTDTLYQKIIRNILYLGDLVRTRNEFAISKIDLDPVTFTTTPLVTIRHTAWKTAIREMEWFMSGKEKCPDELLPWWSNQLNKEGFYLSGYSKQFRHAAADHINGFDQVHFILEGLRHHSESRRLVMTAWNPFEMAFITQQNNNLKTPSTCHSTVIQFFVRGETLYMTSYQRSADMLLGVQHNWIQSWALLLWFAYHSKLKVGHLRWVFGDAHIYAHDTHIKAATEIIACDSSPVETNSFNLIYQPQNDSEVFRADDFLMEGIIPEPKVFTRPVLL